MSRRGLWIGIGPSFVDNVNRMSKRAELSRNQRQLNEVCQNLPCEFSRMFGPPVGPVGLDGCEMRQVAGRPALYPAFDGADPGNEDLSVLGGTSFGEYDRADGNREERESQAHDG